MAEKERIFFCIDMKTFFASVECADRGLNPFETGLVVADVTRGPHALCLAVSPRMKEQGVRNRCRLSDIPKNIRYTIAPPRMARYIDYAARIYAVYLDYVAPEDIHVYSIDEAFIDVTAYLALYHTDALSFARVLMQEIANRCRIPSTVGIGTNLYLAKIALDITAKHAKEHIGYLNEETYRETLWHHRPITDFWMVSHGTSARLARLGAFDMYGVTRIPTDTLYREFGKNAELLIDHAWGREPCLIEDIKNYRPSSRSLSFSQILPRDYSVEETRIIVREMAQNGAEEMMRQKVITNRIALYVGYSFGERAPDKGTTRLTVTTNLSSFLTEATVALYDRTVHTDGPCRIRQIGIAFSPVYSETCEGYDLFCNFDDVEREKRRQQAILDVKRRYGKNAVMAGYSYLPAAMQRERNRLIGGHRAGENEERV